MKKLKTPWFYVVVAIFMMFPSIAFGENDIYTDVKKSANELAEVLVNDYNVSGVQYALISDGKIVVSGTSGIFHKGNVKTLDNKSIFGIGSISKMFPTTAIMLLSDQGKLNLDEPVATYLPEFKMADERYKEITVRMLLNHSSGIMGSLYVNSGMYDYPTT
ncbi:MAG: serine hydrolase, partial [Clostridiaceae bacterium]|nr:serine hydrolase [Clostridiaceae bacterium]